MKYRRKFNPKLSRIFYAVFLGIAFVTIVPVQGTSINSEKENEADDVQKATIAISPEPPTTFTELGVIISQKVRQEQPKRGRRRQYVPYSEMSGLMRQEFAELERARRLCHFGHYLSIELQTCEPCRKCFSETDLSLCGIDCRGYFRERHLLSQIENKNFLSYVSTSLTILLLAFSIYVVCELLKLKKKNVTLSKRLKEIEDRNRAPPTGDKNVDGHPVQPTEQTTFIEQVEIDQVADH